MVNAISNSTKHTSDAVISVIDAFAISRVCHKINWQQLLWTMFSFRHHFHYYQFPLLCTVMSRNLTVVIVSIVSIVFLCFSITIVMFWLLWVSQCCQYSTMFSIVLRNVMCLNLLQNPVSVVSKLFLFQYFLWVLWLTGNVKNLLTAPVMYCI